MMKGRGEGLGRGEEPKGESKGDLGFYISFSIQSDLSPFMMLESKW